MTVIPSIKEQRAFVRDAARRASDVDVVAADVQDDWEFAGIVTVDELAASGARGKLRKIQRICKDEAKPCPQSCSKCSIYLEKWLRLNTILEFFGPY